MQRVQGDEGYEQGAQFRSSSHLEGQETFMMRMGENGIKDTWTLEDKTPRNSVGELCPDSRNKRTEENSLHLGRLQGML